MKRIAALIASATVAVAILSASPAQAANESQCPTDVSAEEQVDCLRAENAGLRSDVDWLTFKLTIAAAQTDMVEAKLAATQTSLGYATGALERMTDRFTFQRDLAAERRTTILELRHELRDRD